MDLRERVIQAGMVWDIEEEGAAWGRAALYEEDEYVLALYFSARCC